MGFQSNTSGVPVMATYAEAVAHEAKIKPIRGRAVECKPVGQRNITHATIRRDADDIVVRIYSTDIVRYKPDGRVIINQGGHASNATRAYLNAMVKGYFSSHQGVTVWSNSETKGWFILHYRADNIFIPDPENPHRLIFTNPIPQVTHKKDRAGMKAIRARYAPFIRYMKNIVKLQGQNNLWRPGYPDRMSNAQVLELARSDDLENHYKAMVYFAWRVWSGDNPFRRFEKALMAYHSDEAFIEVTLPLGELAVDKYKSFF